MTTDLATVQTDLASTGFTLTDQWTGLGGGGIRITFPNGWGLSIIRHDGSYGGKEGLFEALDVLPNGNLAEEPRGWLTPDEVVLFAREVASR